MGSVSLVKREYLVWEASGMFKGAYFGAFCRLVPGKFQLIGTTGEESDA